MYNQPYFIPGYFNSFGPSLMRGPMMGGMGRSALGLGNAMNGARMVGQGIGTSRGLGLLGKLGNSMRTIKAINWGGLINNASKTLNVVNQAIPLVRQVGPMMNNMRSILRVASIFKDETDIIPSRNITNSNNNSTNNLNNRGGNINSYSSNIKEETPKKEEYISYDNSPTFFVNS